MQLFSPIAETYERVNHVLTFGLDMYWRRVAADEAVRGGGDGRWLDVCTGTGEMAAALACRAGPGTTVTALDANPEMLAVAARKITLECPFTLVRGDVGRLPFPGGTFDLVTISFAARTVATAHDQLFTLFSEIHRIIAPDGRFVIVETSQPELSPMRWLFHRFVHVFVPTAGRLMTGSHGGYKYLAHTITRFPGAEELAGLLVDAGFDTVRFRRLFPGVAAVHVARVASSE